MYTVLYSVGFWSRHVGEISDPKVAVPIHPAEHYHLHTKPVPDLPPDTPVVRDPDGYIYFRENEGRFLAGGFEPKVVGFFITYRQKSIPGSTRNSRYNKIVKHCAVTSLRNSCVLSLTDPSIIILQASCKYGDEVKTSSFPYRY